MKEINVSQLTLNPFERLHKQWALLSAGTPEAFNMMTVSWGALGVIWQKPSCTIYVRESRYTKEFIDRNELFTVSFLKEGSREALNLLGSKSGREINKMTESGLTPVFMMAHRLLQRRSWYWSAGRYSPYRCRWKTCLIRRPSRQIIRPAIHMYSILAKLLRHMKTDLSNGLETP